MGEGDLSRYQHHRRLLHPRCCYPTTCCCGKNNAVNGARAIAALDIFMNITCLLFLLAVRCAYFFNLYI
jgi:hypothetical protein